MKVYGVYVWEKGGRDSNAGTKTILEVNYYSLLHLTKDAARLISRKVSHFVYFFRRIDHLQTIMLKTLYQLIITMIITLITLITKENVIL